MSDEKFEYTYSSLTEEERREAEYIRKQYAKKDNGRENLTKLRKLDNKVKNYPTVIALTVGIVGTLIFGTGLTMILEWAMLIWGIVVCAAGIIAASAAYLIFGSVSKRMREKYSEEILRLSNEILESGEEN